MAPLALGKINTSSDSKKIILLAGYPATGKSYLNRLILDQHPECQTINQDDLKESLWDQHGFDTIEEKTALEQASWAIYYVKLEEAMKAGAVIISDYPFSDKQKPKLKALSQTYDYDVLTIRLVGDIETLYERSRDRDLDPSRHLGHLVSQYHQGDKCQDRSKASCFVTFETFRQRCLERGYDRFRLGQLIEVDVTDFEKVAYESLLKEIDAFIEK